GPAIVRGGLTLLRNPQGVLRVRPGRRQLPISGFRVTADEVVLLATTATATDPAGWELRLRSQRLTVPGTVAAGPDGSVTVTFALAADPWGSGPRPLGRGRYSVEAVLAPGATPVPVTIAPQDFDACDAELVTAAIAGRFLVGEDGALELAVLAPLADEERGAYHRERLRVAYRSREVAPEPRAVLFCSNRGDSATDSQLALHHELRRRGSDLTLYWVVSDHSVALPERAVPVVRDSAEYYRVVAAAGFLCNNSDFGHWFRKRDHQRFLQTFHGYPFKTMGISRWTDDGLSPAQIEAAVRHRRDAWDTILTPDPAMNEYYQREFGYDGEILSVGYPRNDALLAAGTEQVRARTREVVGVEPGQRAVLYAPTWRETLSTGAWSARMVDNLDLDALTEALGPDHVLLLRGHSFNARTRRRVTGSSRIVDVTDHPEINDLVLASDLAVLDYSSLRFDYALTGKPMLFYVPDLAAYRELSRGFLYDYEPTAPGPLVCSTAELAAAVLDLDEVRREYAAAYEQFNARFNSRHDGHAAARVVDAFFATAAAPAKVDPPRSGREL
ncbi:MAG TPA: CDP-glycerol glycerophosphotransferase family protein, partial [Candidatus Nanopelagicales bacterium]|nr:CDP-glycerol glycerophosphotransferase family protein [Candidatus Nanopelagicales bacterium]